MKSTRKRKSFGWLVAKRGFWAMRWQVNGRTVQESTQFRVDVKADRIRAERLLEERTEISRLTKKRDQIAVLLAEREEIEQRLRRLQAAAAQAPTFLQLKDLADVWRNSPRRRDCSEAQLERYLKQLSVFVDFAGAEVEMRVVDDAFAERFAAYLSGITSGGTYNKYLNVLTAVWKAVGKSAGCGGNPWQDLPRKRLDAHERRVVSPAEVDRVLEVAEGEWRGLLVIGIYTGLRLGDACRLQWSAFKRGGVVAVKTSKTGSAVCLPSAKLLTALKAVVPRGEGNGYVLPEIAAIYMRDPGTVSHRIARIFERAGIKVRVKRRGWSRARPEVSFHSLRHTFVTRAIEAGVPAEIVRALVGHSTLAMTEHYTHVGSAAVLDAFEKAGI